MGDSSFSLKTMLLFLVIGGALMYWLLHPHPKQGMKHTKGKKENEPSVVLLQRNRQARQRITQVRTPDLDPSVNLIPSTPPVNSSVDTKNCVSLPGAARPTTICTYDPVDDVFISGSIHSGRLWEKDMVQFMVKVLQENPDMQLVDIGSNIGVYTLTAAALGRFVLSVDMLNQNTRLVQNSLELSNMSSQVILVQNVLHRHRNLKLGIMPWTGNIGGTRVAEDYFANGILKSTCLDDLVPLLRSRTVFMKLDIEGTEHHALACGHQFFRHIDVKYIQMEWINKPKAVGQEIIDFAIKFNFQLKTLSKQSLVPFEGDLIRFEGDLFFVKQEINK